VRRAANVLVVAAVAAALLAAAAGAEPIELRASSVAFSEQEIEGKPNVGKLAFRGALHLTSPDARFGGLSGLIATPRGETLIAVSDKGHWLTMQPRYGVGGMLVGIGAAGEIGALIDPRGNPARRGLVDAEEIALTPDGIAVAFEGAHRIWRYPWPRGAAPFALPPVPLGQPQGLERAPGNEGIEAMASLADGRLFVLAEGLRLSDGEFAGWVSAGAPHSAWHPVGWRPHGRFVPTGAAVLPSGDVLVLERRFSWLGGFASRLARVTPAAIVPGARLLGEEIAVLQTPLVHENFEAVAAAARDGETLIYLLSDDNYTPLLQRTLLAMFALVR
jgi:hypothetical protein